MKKLLLTLLLILPTHADAARLFVASNSDKIVCPVPATWTTDLSFSVWVKPATLPASGVAANFLGYGYGPTDNSRKLLAKHYNNSGTRQIYGQFTRNGSANNDAHANVALMTGVWQHIAITIHITDVSTPVVTKFYLDGVLQTTAGDGNGIMGTAAVPDTFNIGNEVFAGSNTNYFDGDISDLAVWQDVTVLNQSEVTALTRGVRPDKVRINPIRYYPLEGWQTTEPDYGISHLGSTSISGTSRSNGPPVLPR